MARVEVDRGDYVDATLPRVCALTGGDAEDWVRVASRRLPD